MQNRQAFTALYGPDWLYDQFVANDPSVVQHVLFKSCAALQRYFSLPLTLQTTIARHAIDLGCAFELVRLHTEACMDDLDYLVRCPTSRDCRHVYDELVKTPDELKAVMSDYVDPSIIAHVERVLERASLLLADLKCLPGHLLTILARQADTHKLAPRVVELHHLLSATNASPEVSDIPRSFFVTPVWL